MRSPPQRSVSAEPAHASIKTQNILSAIFSAITCITNVKGNWFHSKRKAAMSVKKSRPTVACRLCRNLFLRDLLDELPMLGEQVDHGLELGEVERQGVYFFIYITGQMLAGERANNRISGE